ncbi:MAG: DUF1833 family protein [Alkalispirochaeta sp.]
MSRPVSAAFWSAIASERTSEVFLLLVTVDHPQLGSPLRYVYNTQPVTSRGDVFEPTFFRFDGQDEGEDGILTGAQLTLEAVDRQIIEILRQIDQAPSVTTEIVISSDPDSVEIGPFVFDVRSVAYNAQVVRCELEYRDVMSDEFPVDAFTPENTPGLF